MTNTALLKKAIKDTGIKIFVIMEALEIKSYETIRRKINNRASFTAGEIQILCELLRLTKEQREQIFFASETECNSVSA